MILFGMQTAHAQQSGSAQPLVWVQIEAQPSLNAINEALRRRSSELRDVNGFYQGSGWYGVALGPYNPEDAQNILRTLRAEGRIPRDSYIAERSEYERQIWPIGVDQLTMAEAATLAPETQDDTQAPIVAEPALVPETALETEPEPVVPVVMDESPREARASEAQLSRDERADLQIAMAWAGHYQGAIDAAFGAGTRRAMADWQTEQGFEPTGILTTMQRAELLRQYNAVLDGLGVQTVTDSRMGIEMKLPTGVVAFARYEPPFAHFDASGDIPARVLMISQEGNQDTLFGLYDIMQTLQIVPQDGPRERRNDGFVLVGENATTVSHTEVTLSNGRIKGFTLVWPAGDEERRSRLLALMQDSFTRIDGVLDPAAGSNEEQSIDLISGLEIRKPLMTRSGFYVDQQGTVVTTSQGVAACGRITIDDDYDAEIVLMDEASGIAVLRPVQALAPMSVAAFQQSAPRIKAGITVAGYSYGGVLGAPSLTYGEIADLRGLDGEDHLNRLALAAQDEDAGGPVIDAGGAVLGMLLPAVSEGRQLPDGVSFAADAATVQKVLEQAGIRAAWTSEQGQLPPSQLGDRAAGMTVLVSCWE